MAESQTINNMKLPTIGEGRTAAGTTNQRKGKSRKMRSDRIPEKRQYRVKTNTLLQLNFTSQGADNDETDTSDVAGDADNLTDQANKKRMSSAGGLNLLSSKPRKRMGKVSRISPKARFRRIVRKVINAKLHKDPEIQKTGGKGEGQLFFDKTLFKSSNKNRGLTSIEKRILEKNPENRTEDDLQILKGVVDRLKCFDKYTRIVKRDLSRVIFYMTLNANRYIIKQGHDGFSFYFIVSGKVQVRITDTEKGTGQKHEFAVAEMSEGSSFGELALLHNIKRTATIVCIANGSEFLRVDRHDFELVLRMSTEKEWNERLKMLKWQPNFKDFEDEELDELNNHCRVFEYAPGNLIIGNTQTDQDSMLFVASGVCSIVRELYITRERLESGKEKLHLLKETPKEAEGLTFLTDGYGLLQRRNAASRFLKSEKQLWSVGCVGKGFYFGVGEDLRNTYVLAKNKVEILAVRRIKFIKNGRWKLAEKMKEQFNTALPTNKDLFDKYMQESYWDHYKQKLCVDIVKKRKVRSNTQWEDVPLAIRVNSLRAGSCQRHLHTHFKI